GRVHGDQAIVQVFARGAADLHGAALRLTYDAERLTFASATSSGAWSSQALALAKEGTPGELAVVWSEKGSARGVDAKTDTLLGTLRFDIHAPGPVTLAFRQERSSLLGSDGVPLSTGYYGGRLVER